MLILSRNPGQSIIINDDIKITFFGMNFYEQGKFGFEAPDNVTIHREEIYKRIMASIQPRVL